MSRIKMGDLEKISAIKPLQCQGNFHPKQKDGKIFEIHLDLVMLVFIG